MLAPDRDSQSVDIAEIVDEVILSRRSVRAFLPDPVEDELIREILALGSRAPSGTNMQPWKAYVTRGEVKERISRAILESGLRAEKIEWDEYKYYPDKFFEPYLQRRRTVGYALYEALGIHRREVERMRAQHDRRLNQGSWIDHGMFLQTVMLAARARGLHTCPQAAFAPYHRQIRPILGIPDEEIVVCGIAVGYEDSTKPENAFRTERAPLEEWVRFVEE